MTVISYIKQSSIVHLWLWCIFLLSALLVTSLQLLTLILWPFSKRWYRSANGELIKLFWFQYVWLTDYWSGSAIHIYFSDDELPFVGTEHALMVMNHRQDVDWMVVWQLAARFKMLQGGKALMKNELKYVPFIGWSFYLSEQIFVNRNYKKDKEILLKQLKNITTFHFPCVTTIFCEGTRYTKEKYEQSQLFAQKRGIPGLKYHLLPRTKGFTLCVEAYKGAVPSIYDGTIAYAGQQAPSVYDLMCGKKFDCHVYMRRIPMEEVPTDSEEATSEFCHQLYREKDKAYDYFVQHNSFSGFDPSRVAHNVPVPRLPMYVMTLWMVVIGIPLLYLVYTILTTGSATMIFITVVVVFGVIHFARSMLTLTKSASGSSYGVNKEKQG